MPAPFVKQLWDREQWILTADHRGWYVLEKTSDKSYQETVKAFIDKDRESPEPSYLLFWSLTSTWRNKQKLSFQHDPEGREIGARVPLSFLEVLPTGKEFAQLENSLLELLAEAGVVTLSVVEGGEKTANPPAPSPAESTGDGEK